MTSRISIDERIGRSIRLRRQIAGLSQADLGRAVGITGQQIYKYEVGASRITAGRLWSIAEALGVPIGLFFADLGADADRRGHLPLGGLPQA